MIIFPPTWTGPPVAKDHIFLFFSSFFFSFFSFFSTGPLLDWLGQITLYSHWSTQTGCSKHARVPATNKTVLLDFEHSANEDVLWLSATLTACDLINLNYFRRFVLRVLLTIKLDKTFCLVSGPGPVRPAAVSISEEATRRQSGQRSDWCCWWW